MPQKQKPNPHTGKTPTPPAHPPDDLLKEKITWQPTPPEEAPTDGVEKTTLILSHSHRDHVSEIPKLARRQFDGKSNLKSAIPPADTPRIFTGAPITHAAENLLFRRGNTVFMIDFGCYPEGGKPAEFITYNPEGRSLAVVADPATARAARLGQSISQYQKEGYDVSLQSLPYNQTLTIPIGDERRIEIENHPAYHLPVEVGSSAYLFTEYKGDRKQWSYAHISEISDTFVTKTLAAVKKAERGESLTPKEQATYDFFRKTANANQLVIDGTNILSAESDVPQKMSEAVNTVLYPAVDALNSGSKRLLHVDTPTNKLVAFGEVIAKRLTDKNVPLIAYMGAQGVRQLADIYFPDTETSVQQHLKHRHGISFTHDNAGIITGLTKPNGSHVPCDRHGHLDYEDTRAGFKLSLKNKASAASPHPRRITLTEADGRSIEEKTNEKGRTQVRIDHPDGRGLLKEYDNTYHLRFQFAGNHLYATSSIKRLSERNLVPLDVSKDKKPNAKRRKQKNMGEAQAIEALTQERAVILTPGKFNKNTKGSRVIEHTIQQDDATVVIQGRAVRRWLRKLIDGKPTYINGKVRPVKADVHQLWGSGHVHPDHFVSYLEKVAEYGRKTNPYERRTQLPLTDLTNDTEALTQGEIDSLKKYTTLGAKATPAELKRVVVDVITRWNSAGEVTTGELQLLKRLAPLVSSDQARQEKTMRAINDAMVDRESVGRADAKVFVDTSNRMRSYLKGLRNTPQPSTDIGQPGQDELFEVTDINPQRLADLRRVATHFTGFFVAVEYKGATDLSGIGPPRTIPLGLYQRPAWTSRTPWPNRLLSAMAPKTQKRFLGQPDYGFKHASEAVELANSLADPLSREGADIDRDVLETVAFVKDLTRIQRGATGAIRERMRRQLDEELLEAAGLPEDQRRKALDMLDYLKESFAGDIEPVTGDGATANGEKRPGLEEQVVFDADRLLMLGKRGLRKITRQGAKWNRPFYNPELALEERLAYRRGQDTGREDTLTELLHYAYRWHRPENFYTDQARELAARERREPVKKVQAYLHHLYLDDPRSLDETLQVMEQFGRRFEQRSGR